MNTIKNTIWRRTDWAVVVSAALFAYLYSLDARYFDINGVWAHGVAWRLLGGSARAIDLSDLNFPLSYDFFHGMGNGYLAVPFVWLFGHTTTAFTANYFVFAALSIFLIHRSSLLLYRDAWAAAWTCLMLAATPSFVVMSFAADYCALGSFTFGLAGIYGALRYADERKPWLAYLGCLCLGVSLSCRTYAAALLAGLLTFAVIHRRRLQALLPRRRALWIFLAGCCGAFLSFMAPFLLAILRNPRGFASAWVNGLSQPDGGGDNSAFLTNLGTRITQLRPLLNGGLLMDSSIGKSHDSHVFGWGLVLMSALIGMLWSCRLGGPARRRLPGVVVLVFLLLSSFTVSILRPSHLYPVLPHLLLAAGSLLALSAATKLRPWALAAFSLLAAARVWDSAIFFRHIAAELNQTGGTAPSTLQPGNIFSLRASSDLAACLTEMGAHDAVMLNNGPAHAVTYLSGGAVHARNLLPPVVEDSDAAILSDYRPRLGRLCRETQTAFVVDITPGSFQLLFRAFQRELADRNKKLSLYKTILKPNGESIFAVYRIAPR